MSTACIASSTAINVQLVMFPIIYRGGRARRDWYPSERNERNVDRAVFNEGRKRDERIGGKNSRARETRKRSIRSIKKDKAGTHPEGGRVRGTKRKGRR